MGFLSDLGSAISNAISTTVNIISNTISSIGNAIGGYAKSIIMDTPKIMIFEIIKIIVEVVHTIAEALGLIKKEETTEELGAKAMQAEKKAEEFNSTEEYIRYLREEIELDKEKFEKMSPEEKLACSAVGISILSKGIEEKKGIEIPSDFWVEVGKQKIKAEEVNAYIENFKANNMDLKLSDYLKGNLSPAENKQVYPVIEDTLKKLNPELSKEDIDNKVYEMKQVSREAEKA